MVQFKVSRFLGLDVQVDGMILVNQSGFQLVFNQPEDAMKLWEADSESVQLPWDELLSWEVDYGFLGDQLRMSVKSPQIFGQLPGVKDGRVTLDIRKAERDRLKQLEQRARDYQAGRRQDDAEARLDDIRDFLYDFDDE